MIAWEYGNYLSVHKKKHNAQACYEEKLHVNCIDRLLSFCAAPLGSPGHTPQNQRLLNIDPLLATRTDR